VQPKLLNVSLEEKELWHIRFGIVLLLRVPEIIKIFVFLPQFGGKVCGLLGHKVPYVVCVPI